VARDRQRGKQRRARQSDQSAPAARPVSRDDEALERDPHAPAADGGAVGDQGVEDVLDERGPEGTTPTPDPLKHVSSYIDEAKLAEAGADVDRPGEDAGERPREDAGERDAGGLGYSGDPAEDSERERVAGVEAPTRRRGRTTSFLRQSAEELKRVQWPDRRQTGQGTAVTLGFVVLAGGFLGLMDAIWKPIIEAII
jgi:preprotein translocase SecE subunit